MEVMSYKQSRQPEINRPTQRPHIRKETRVAPAASPATY